MGEVRNISYYKCKNDGIVYSNICMSLTSFMFVIYEKTLVLCVGRSLQYRRTAPAVLQTQHQDRQ